MRHHQFAKTFAPQDILDIFEMDVNTADGCMTATFHYCPLVKSWQKLGFSEEKIAELCDIAMDGDRGIADTLPDYEFTLESTLAGGARVCRLVFTRKH